MKTIVLTFWLLCISLPSSLFAQNNWTLSGNGNAINGTSFIGTTTNVPVDIRTNGTLRIHVNGDSIASNGFVGIGNNFISPQSVLHVNGIGNKTGNLLQTTGSNSYDNTWTMSVTGYNAARFIVRNRANSFNADLITNNNGEINFFTNNAASGGARSMSIQGGVGNVSHGQVAFGNKLPDSFDAQSRLHLHKTVESGTNTGGNFIQFTSTNTFGGDAPQFNSGFQIGVPSAGNAIYLRQWENAPMQFFVGSNQNQGSFPQVRLHINANMGQSDEGYIGINNATPTSRLDLNGDLRIRLAEEAITPDALLVGMQHSPGNPNDLDVRRIAFNGDPNTYLAGDGTWQSLPGVNKITDPNIRDSAYRPIATEIDQQFAQLRAELAAKDAIIRELSARLDKIESCLKKVGLYEANTGTIEATPENIQLELQSAIDVNLRNTDQIILGQNKPNPFAERTTISYVVPEYIQHARIDFYDSMGQLIHSVDIREKGKGSLNVFGGDLSTGMYSYSLVVDGQVATKRMMKE